MTGPWFTLKREDVGKSVCGMGLQLWLESTPQRRDYEANRKRFRGRNAGRMRRMDGVDRDNARLNITKSTIETLVSRIGSSRPRPRILVSGGNWSLRAKAKKMQKFLDQVYKASKMYELAKGCVRDAMLAGTGVLYHFPDVPRRKVATERVLPGELLVDSAEAYTGCPQTLIRVKHFSPEVLQAMFPRVDVSRMETVDATELGQDAVVDGGQLIRVYEAWHLARPLDVGAKDEADRYEPGRHVIAAGDTTLVDEPWGYDYFPFTFLHWCPPTDGFWGDSAAGEIRGLEREANIMLQRVQKAMKLTGQPMVMAPRSAKVGRAKMTDEIMALVEYDGQVPPTITVGTPSHPQVLQQIWDLKKAAFEQLGTNEYQASAVKPPGIESGRALEQLSEEHIVRFKDFMQRFEGLVAEDIARQVLRCARDLDAALRERGVKEGYVVHSADRRTSLKLVWKDVAISPDDMFVETWPTSILPLTPSARTEEIQRWQDAGWITPQRAISLAEIPDLESEGDLLTADGELLDYQLEQMLDDGKRVSPIVRQNLEFALLRGTYALECAIKEGVPLAHQDQLSVFLDEVQALLDAKQSVEMGAQGLPGPMPLPGQPGSPMPGLPPPPGMGMPGMAPPLPAPAGPMPSPGGVIPNG
jgi:hypothetical protein